MKLRDCTLLGLCILLSNCTSGDSRQDAHSDAGADATTDSASMPDAPFSPDAGVCDQAGLLAQLSTGRATIGHCTVDLSTAVIDRDVIIEGTSRALSVLRVPNGNIGLVVSSGAHVTLHNLRLQNEGRVGVYALDADAFTMQQVDVTSSRAIAVAVENVTSTTLREVTFEGVNESVLASTAFVDGAIGSEADAARVRCGSTPVDECAPGATRTATCDNCAGQTDICDACGQWRGMLPLVGLLAYSNDATDMLSVQDVEVSGFARAGVAVGTLASAFERVSLHHNAGVSFISAGVAATNTSLRQVQITHTLSAAFGKGSGLWVSGGGTNSSNELTIEENAGFGAIFQDVRGAHTRLTSSNNGHVGVFLDHVSDFELGDSSAVATDVTVKSNTLAGIVVATATNTTIDQALIEGTRNGTLSTTTGSVTMGDGLVIVRMPTTLQVRQSVIRDSQHVGIVIALPTASTTAPSAPSRLFDAVSVMTTGVTPSQHGFLFGHFDNATDTLTFYDDAETAAWRSGVSVSATLTTNDEDLVNTTSILTLPLSDLLNAVTIAPDVRSVTGPIM